MAREVHRKLSVALAIVDPAKAKPWWDLHVSGEEIHGALIVGLADGYCTSDEFHEDCVEAPELLAFSARRHGHVGSSNEFGAPGTLFVAVDCQDAAIQYARAHLCYCYGDAGCGVAPIHVRDAAGKEWVINVSFDMGDYYVENDDAITEYFAYSCRCENPTAPGSVRATRVYHEANPAAAAKRFAEAHAPHPENTVRCTRNILVVDRDHPSRRLRVPVTSEYVRDDFVVYSAQEAEVLA